MGQCRRCAKVSVNLYDTLFTAEFPGRETGNFIDDLNPNSFTRITAFAEKELLNAKPGDSFQFLRKAYFVCDTKLSKPGQPVFNRSVSLKESFKIK